MVAGGADHARILEGEMVVTMAFLQVVSLWKAGAQPQEDRQACHLPQERWKEFGAPVHGLEITLNQQRIRAI